MKIENIEEELLFDEESVNHLSPEKRTEMVQLMVKQILQQHPEGLTTKDLAEYSGLSTKTVKKHLDYLTAVREAYEKKYRTRLTIYFPNGKLVHPFSDIILNIRDTTFSFQYIENTFGKFIYVQERKKDLYTNKTRTVGGILIEKESIDKFIEHLEEIKETWSSEDGTEKIHKIGR